MRRLLTTAAVAAALSVSASALVVGTAGVAGAVTPTPGSSVACAKISYSNSTGEATVSKCYNSSGASTGKTYKELIAPSAATLLVGGTLNWSPGPSGGATIVTSALGSATATGTCSKKDTNEAFSGTVESVTGSGNPAAAEDDIYVDVCLSGSASALKVSLAKGTDAEF